MNTVAIASLPKKVQVKELISSRYDDLYEEGVLPQGARPQVWDNRVAGTDVIRIEAGEELLLKSSGQQSPPQAGWTLMLTGGDTDGYTWTLYGMPPLKEAH